MASPRLHRVTYILALLLLAFAGTWLSVRHHRDRVRQELHRADSLRAIAPIRELGHILDEPEVVVCETSGGFFDETWSDCYPRQQDQRDSIHRRQERALAILEGMGTLDTFAVAYLETRVRSATSAWIRELAVELLGRAGRNLSDIGTRLSALSALDTSATWKYSLSDAHLQARTPQAASEVAVYIDSMIARRDRIAWPFVALGILGPRSRDLRTRIDGFLAESIPEVHPYTRQGWRRSTLRALGWTRDEFWLPVLLEGLRDSVDWPSACAAAISLGNLGDTSALPALQTLAATHWYAPVRESAQVAIGRLTRGLPREMPDYEASFLGSLYGESQGCLTPPAIVPPRGDTVSDCGSPEPESLATLRYRRHIHTLGDDMRSKTTIVQATPQIACRLADGLVLGNDEGEWGGEIAWRSPDGRITILDSNSVQEFHQMPWGLLAVNSHRHMGMFSGRLLTITPVPKGLPRVTLFQTLPGALIRSWKTPDGGLYLECSNGHLVLDSRGRPHAWPPLPR